MTGVIVGLIVAAVPAGLAAYAILMQRYQQYVAVALATWGLAHLFFFAWSHGHFGPTQAVTMYTLVNAVWGLGLVLAVLYLPALLDKYAPPAVTRPSGRPTRRHR